MPSTVVWNWWFSRAGVSSGGVAVPPLVSGPFVSGLLALILCPALGVADTTVYRSVGDDGVVVFSDQGEASDPGTEVLNIPVSTVQVDAQARLKELRATNNSLERARRARERARATSSSAAPTVRYTAPPDGRRAGSPTPQSEYPVRPYLWPRNFYRGPVRPQSVPPGRVPPDRVPPGFKVIQPGNQQLMRPVVSSRD
ncbi:MAG: DUF4124 domain-containing protein [Chromatocurvus sp.]